MPVFDRRSAAGSVSLIDKWAYFKVFLLFTDLEILSNRNEHVSFAATFFLQFRNLFFMYHEQIFTMLVYSGVSHRKDHISIEGEATDHHRRLRKPLGLFPPSTGPPKVVEFRRERL